MTNFEEIAKKCLAGELKGTFRNRKGDNIPSEELWRCSSKTYPYVYCISHSVTIHGDYYKSGKLSEYDIIDFIPDNMQKQIKIDIPEGKVPIMEQTNNGVVITWKEKELTYGEICIDLFDKDKHISAPRYCNNNCNSLQFKEKIEVLRRLINIRNYFGKPDKHGGFIISPSLDDNGNHEIIFGYSDIQIMFKEKEHAEQAIKILGDELKYLFEPW